MKYKLTLISLMLILAVAMTGCSNGGVSVEFTFDDFSESNHITHDVSTAVGSEIEITLSSNPTTGFQAQNNRCDCVHLLKRGFTRA